MKRNRLILALDLPNPAEALRFLDPLSDLIKKVKVGPALFIEAGPAFVETLQKKGFEIFLDLKLHDIPNTVALGVKGAKNLGVWMVSLHLSGGRKMLIEAVKASGGSPLLAGITVLTSFGPDSLQEVGVSREVGEQVSLLAKLAGVTGLDGIVASPLEVASLRKALGHEMLIITPGIRFEKSERDDQARTMGPREALEAGADYLVIGRPLLQAEKPRAFLETILSQMEKVSR